MCEDGEKGVRMEGSSSAAPDGEGERGRMKVGFRLCGDESRAGNGVVVKNWGWLLGGCCWVEESLNRG